ncbi:hypothetical protein H6P81_019628 [Aristolochia fimbriata]|uniref:Hflx-type G domain-containing protein n=1 Tax=Aristolochia fimbriata TaxID=158543 RepID=A0AAV7DSD3_ARIFI|nr:hypothetical protein H6P81_019628 [Aristolochia fimbriata]
MSYDDRDDAATVGLANPNPRTYIGSGKVAEIKSAVDALDVETVIFDDELSAGLFCNLEKAFGGDVSLCDRIALILDIFNQRAATHEASLQKLESVRQHRKQYRNRRLSVPVPVVSLVNGGKEFLLTDTVGFIQKLPTTLVAAFRATLEEISESSLLVHVVDISHPLAQLQIDAVNNVLAELDAESIPKCWCGIRNVCVP